MKFVGFMAVILSAWYMVENITIPEWFGFIVAVVFSLSILVAVAALLKRLF